MNTSRWVQLIENLGATAYSPEQVVGHLKLCEDGREMANGTKHLTNHSVRSTQCWINLVIILSWEIQDHI